MMQKNTGYQWTRMYTKPHAKVYERGPEHAPSFLDWFSDELVPAIRLAHRGQPAHHRPVTLTHLFTIESM